MLHDAKGPPKPYTMSYTRLERIIIFFLISLDSETSLRPELSPVHIAKTEVCLSSSTEHLLRCDLAEDKYFSSNHLICYLGP